VNPSELEYPEPHVVLGGGAQGTVEKAMFRGIEVAVKKVYKNQDLLTLAGIERELDVMRLERFAMIINKT
jgi:hypothetical protein